MPSAKRDIGAALKNRIAPTDRPQIAETPGERIMPGAKLVAVSRVRPDPGQPRKRFDPVALEELAASIRDRGILHPLIVRPMNEQYVIIIGERRYRAAILAGLGEVPVIVRDATDEQAYLDALIENLQRADLTIEEEAEAYRGLLSQGLSVRQIAEKLGTTPSKVSRVMRICKDRMLSEAIINGKITKSQAQELLVAPDEEKLRLVQFIAGRREKAMPVSLDELRSEVDQARAGVALRNTLKSTRSSTKADRFGENVADKGTPLIAQLGFTLETARRQARALRSTIEQQLPPLIALVGDAQIASELEAIRLAVEQALAGGKDRSSRARSLNGSEAIKGVSRGRSR